MYYVITVAVLVCACLLIHTLYFNKRDLESTEVEADKPILTTIEIDETTTTTNQDSDIQFKLKKEYLLDSTDDSKALGYTGQRKIAVDSRNNIYMTYRKKYKGNYEIFVSKLSRQSSGNYLLSGVDTPIATVGSGATQRVPSLVVSQNGVVHVVWYGLDPKNDNLGRQIKYSQSKDEGKTWSKWENISVVAGHQEEDYWQEHPQIVVQENNVYIVWEGKDIENSQQQIKFSKSSDGGNSFEEWKNVQPTPKNTQSRPSIVVDSDGWLHLFMYSSQDTEEDVQQIWHAISKDNGINWSKWKNISKSSLDARHVSAVFDGKSILAVWRQQAVGKEFSQLRYSIYTGSEWSDSKVVSQSSNYQMFPNVGLSKDGFAVTWVESSNDSEFPRDNPKGSLGYVSYLRSSTQGFDPPLALSSKHDVLYPQIAITNLNSFYLLYEKENSENYNILFNILTRK